MKLKWLAILLTALLLFVIAALYVFIPSSLLIARNELMACNPDGAFRALSVDSSWDSISRQTDTVQTTFRPGRKRNRKIEITVMHNSEQLTGLFMLLSHSNLDSCIIQWQYNVRVSLNPFKRVRQYRSALSLYHEMGEMIGRMRNYLEQEEHVYGMVVRNALSHDSALVVKQWEAATYPDVAGVYGAISGLRAYAAGQGAKETDPPMLHVQSAANGKWTVMVAIPIDREVKERGAFTFRRFVPWKILAGEVKGGPDRVAQAEIQLQYYIEDHQRTSMAIPFQSLVTERDKEPDSARWVTRVIEPVF